MRRVQDSNLCLPYGRTVFETVALSHLANPPSTSYFTKETTDHEA